MHEVRAADARPGRSLPLAAPKPPPFALLGIHFTAALLYLVLGSVGLVAVAPELAAGNFLAPRVLAVTHLFTLGVITTSIFGVLYQFYPMALGAGARSVRVGFVGAGTLLAGTGVIVIGFWLWRPLLLGFGWTVLFTAVGCVAWNLLPQRRRMTQGRRIAGHVSAGHSALGFAMMLAAARIGESFGWWTVDRLGLIAAHFHLAAFGFAGLTIVGVGSRMLPMFLVTNGTATKLERTVGPTASAGLVVFGVGLTFGIAVGIWLGAVLLIAAGVLYVILVANYFRRRTMRRLDSALGHVTVAFGFLVATMVGGVMLLLQPGFSPRGWIAYGELAVLGWLVLLIVGIYYRIFPFLLWLHVFGGRQAAPTNQAALVREPWAWLSLFMLGVGVVLLTVGTLLGSAGVTRAGALCFSGGSVGTAFQYLWLFRRPPTQNDRGHPHDDRRSGQTVLEKQSC